MEVHYDEPEATIRFLEGWAVSFELGVARIEIPCVSDNKEYHDDLNKLVPVVLRSVIGMLKEGA